jgi:hypothetical protein
MIVARMPQVVESGMKTLPQHWQLLHEDLNKIRSYGVRHGSRLQGTVFEWVGFMLTNRQRFLFIGVAG